MNKAGDNGSEKALRGLFLMEFFVYYLPYGYSGAQCRPCSFRMRAYSLRWIVLKRVQQTNPTEDSIGNQVLKMVMKYQKQTI